MCDEASQNSLCSTPKGYVIREVSGLLAIFRAASKKTNVTLKASWRGFNENKSRLIESSEKNISISPNKRIERY